MTEEVLKLRMLASREREGEAVVEWSPQDSSMGIRTKDEPMGAARHRFATRSLQAPALPGLDLVWCDAAIPDEHFELSWRLGEGMRLRYGKVRPRQVNTFF
jgi:hypothetical protein